MRGIISSAGYVPYHRLAREAIGAAHGGSAGKGTRAVASYDEDTTTLGVEAARLALAPTNVRPASLWFSTVEPAYLDKTNATTIHALPPNNVDRVTLVVPTAAGATLVDVGLGSDEEPALARTIIRTIVQVS